MTILDQPDRWKSIDPNSMYSLIASFPENVRTMAESGRSISLGRVADARVLLMTGLGGSAIGGDLVRSVAGSGLRIPLVVNRDYELPAFADSSSLILACSYSGNTEETISAYRQGKAAKASIVCITSGGKLEQMAKEDGYPVLKLPPGLPPRAALGYSLLMILSALTKLEVLPDMTAQISETCRLLVTLRERYNPETPASGNKAKILAESLTGKVVALYGSSGIMDAVAFRWRSQIEENAKNLSFHHVLPEMNHNELVGWRYPEDVLRKIGVVLLRDKGDHPQVQRRFDLVREIIEPKAGVLHEVWSEGDSLLARVLSSLYLGDYVSLYLAYLNDVDPTPVEVIDYLKKSLSSAR